MTMVNAADVFWGYGEGNKKEYDKRYIYASLCGKQSKQAHDPNQEPITQHDMIPDVLIRFRYFFDQ